MYKDVYQSKQQLYLFENIQTVEATFLKFNTSEKKREPKHMKYQTVGPTFLKRDNGVA